MSGYSITSAFGVGIIVGAVTIGYFFGSLMTEFEPIRRIRGIKLAEEKYSKEDYENERIIVIRNKLVTLTNSLGEGNLCHQENTIKSTIDSLQKELNEIYKNKEKRKAEEETNITKTVCLSCQNSITASQ